MWRLGARSSLIHWGFSQHQRRLNSTLTVVDDDQRSPAGITPPNVDLVWDLWSEGNLFSLQATELQSFLRAQGLHVDPIWKKPVLVKQVEDFISKQQDQGRVLSRELGKKKDPHAIAPAELYGELAVDAAFEGTEQAFVDVQQTGLYSSDQLGPVIPRAFQIMHETISPDVLMVRTNNPAFPGPNAQCKTFTMVPPKPASSNKARFNKAFQWCVMNLWNMNMEGEVHMSFGKMLLWLPPGASGVQPTSMWSVQQELQALQNYSWLTLAHEKNKEAIEQYTAANGWSVAPERSGTSYRVSVKRQQEYLEGEVTPDGKTQSLQSSWERFLLTFYMRDQMPDVRIQLRARRAMKKKTADQFQGVSLLNVHSDGKVSSAVPPELGEVVMAIERTTRAWKKPCTSTTGEIVLTEAFSTVALSKKESRDPRLEYDVTVVLPSQGGDNVDLTAICDELWDTILLQVPGILTTGMKDFDCIPV